MSEQVNEFVERLGESKLLLSFLQDERFEKIEDKHSFLKRIKNQKEVLKIIARAYILKTEVFENIKPWEKSILSFYTSVFVDFEFKDATIGEIESLIPRETIFFVKKDPYVGNFSKNSIGPFFQDIPIWYFKKELEKNPGVKVLLTPEEFLLFGEELYERSFLLMPNNEQLIFSIDGELFVYTHKLNRLDGSLNKKALSIKEQIKELLKD